MRGWVGLLGMILRGQEQMKNLKQFLSDIFYILFHQ